MQTCKSPVWQEVCIVILELSQLRNTIVCLTDNFIVCLDEAHPSCPPLLVSPSFVVLLPFLMHVLFITFSVLLNTAFPIMFFVVGEIDLQVFFYFFFTIWGVNDGVLSDSFIIWLQYLKCKHQPSSGSTCMQLKKTL